MTTDITINGITVSLDSTNAVDIAAALWDAGLVNNIGTYDTSDYLSQMITATAETALWADARHDDDTEGTGEFQDEIDDLRLGFAPDYENALPPAARSELADDVDNFLRVAWLYLAAEGIRPQMAGHDFHLSRNNHGAGFFDSGYEHGDELQKLAETFGPFGLMVAGHGDEDTCEVCGYELYANGSSPETTIWMHMNYDENGEYDPATPDHTPVHVPAIHVYAHHN